MESHPTIIRTRKNRDNPYTMIARGPLNDAALSWEARGVLAYLLDKPDDWEVRFTDLVSKGPGAEDRMRRILHELEAAGYVQRRRLPGARGRFVWITLVYETPALATAQASSAGDLPPAPAPPSRQNRHMAQASPYAGLPSMAEPSMVLPSMVNRHIYKDGTEPNTNEPNTEGERRAPSLSTIENFDPTTQAAWIAEAVQKAGISPSRVDLEGETAAWQDQIRSGAREVPADPQADWRMWMRRHFHWLRTHPQEGHNGEHRTDPTPDLAERKRAALGDLAATLGRPPNPLSAATEPAPGAG